MISPIISISKIPNAEEHIGAAAGFIDILNTEKAADTYRLSLNGGIVDLTDGKAKYGNVFARRSDRYKLRKIQKIAEDVEKIVSEKLRILAKQPGLESSIKVDVIRENLEKLKVKLTDDVTDIVTSHGEGIGSKIAKLFRRKGTHILLSEPKRHTSSGAITFTGLAGLTHTKIQRGFKVASDSLDHLKDPGSLGLFSMKKGVKAVLTQPFVTLDPKELKKNPNRRELKVLVKKIEELEKLKNIDPQIEYEYDMVLAMYNAILANSPECLEQLKQILQKNAERCDLNNFKKDIENIIKPQVKYITKVLAIRKLYRGLQSENNPHYQNQCKVLEHLGLVLTFQGRMNLEKIAPDLSLLDAIMKRSEITPFLDNMTWVKSGLGFGSEKASILKNLDKLQKASLNTGDEEFQIEMDEIFRNVHAFIGKPEEVDVLNAMASQLVGDKTEAEIRATLGNGTKKVAPDKLAFLVAQNLRKLARVKEEESGKPKALPDSEIIRILDQMIDEETRTPGMLDPIKGLLTRGTIGRGLIASAYWFGSSAIPHLDFAKGALENVSPELFYSVQALQVLGTVAFLVGIPRIAKAVGPTARSCKGLATGTAGFGIGVLRTLFAD